jgi:hypothetical protein
MGRAPPGWLSSSLARGGGNVGQRSTPTRRALSVGWRGVPVNMGRCRLQGKEQLNKNVKEIPGLWIMTLSCW